MRGWGGRSIGSGGSRGFLASWGTLSLGAAAAAGARSRSGSGGGGAVDTD